MATELAVAQGSRREATRWGTRERGAARWKRSLADDVGRLALLGALIDRSRSALQLSRNRRGPAATYFGRVVAGRHDALALALELRAPEPGPAAKDEDDDGDAAEDALGPAGPVLRGRVGQGVALELVQQKEMGVRSGRDRGMKSSERSAPRGDGDAPWAAEAERQWHGAAGARRPVKREAARVGQNEGRPISPAFRWLSGGSG